MSAHPPRFAGALLARCLPADLADAVLGDLEEEFRLVLRRGRAPREARAWYWRAVLRLLVPFVRLSLRRHAPALAQAAAVGAIGALATVAAETALWHFVLAQVPLRASHAPPLSLLVPALAVALLLGAAAAGLMLLRPIPQAGGSR